MSDLPALAQTDPASAPSAAVGLPVLARALDGLELFFAGLLPGIGASYLLVQQGEWAEWLAPQLRRITPLPVVELNGAADQTTQVTVQPDHIYLLPPDGSWRWNGAGLQRSEPHAQPHFLADFLSGLAQAFGSRSAAAVLSGMDTAANSLVSLNLERGLGAVAQAGGRVLVQAPETAQYPQWPEAALATSLSTAVLSASELAVHLSAALAQTAPLSQQQAELLGLPYPPEALASDLDNIWQQVQQHTGHDFSGYHWANSLRKIERRVQELALTDAACTCQTAHEPLREYGQWLSQHPPEATLLQQSLVSNSTYFFRDPAAFAALERELQRQLERWSATGDTPGEWRAWVVGCSSGQEAYSVAMLMLELAEAQAAASGSVPLPIRVFASDIDLTLLAKAQRGWYSAATASVLTQSRRQRFFEPRGGGYQVRPELRRCLTFMRHGTFTAAPLGEMHLLSCRNLLAYFSPPLQEHVLATFAYALQEGGVLLLSPSEGLGRTGAPLLPAPEQTLPFALLDRRWRLYRRTAGVCPLPLPLGTVAEATAHADPPQSEASALTYAGERSALSPIGAQAGNPASPSSEVLAQELSYTRAYLQALSEELAQAQEEARAARESLQAAGEQLHSMGQELRRLRQATGDAAE